MNLVTLQSVQQSYGGPLLLHDVSFSIRSGERVCLIGRNGEGKSTLMKIIAGDILPDSGDVFLSKGLKIARLTQEVPAHFTGSVFDVVASALGEKAVLVSRYHHAVQAISLDPSEQNMDRLSQAQQQLEAVDGWSLEQDVETVISKLSLDPNIDVSALSGGLKRRVLLAQALATQPHLLLLDEPTNHLDLEAIQWMEGFLKDWGGAVLFVTHDRQFLRQVATRIIELDRGMITDWPDNYDNYLRRREERLHAEEMMNSRFDKKLAQEEVWIRQGIKARRTRNEGRVRALKAMRDTYSQRRKQQGSAKLQMQQADRSGKLVCEAKQIHYAWGDKCIVKDFSITLLRGDRIGLIGPNGSGKSTLLNLLLGKLKPDSGSIVLGTRLDVVFFDQLRDLIDETKTVIDNVAEGSDQVIVNGKSKHIMSYLQDFLFAPDRSRQPAKALSGGERNRLLLAKLFLKPANLLVLDEPTNDLDVETLELLEELLVEYQGTLIVVSHDRVFLDNVVTSTLVLEGDGQVGHFVGGYSDWLKRSQSASTQKKPESKTANHPQESTETKKREKVKKLSYKLQKELEESPLLIEQYEKQLESIQQSLADPELYKEEPEKVSQLQEMLATTEKQLEQTFERWEELEAMQ